MNTWTATCAASVLPLLVPAPRVEPLSVLSPRATIAHFNGNGTNVPLWDITNGDVPLVVTGLSCPAPAVFGPTTGNPDNAKAVGGQTWGPILNLGPCVTGPGNALVRMRPSCAFGPTVTLPGGCSGQILQAGVLLGTIVAQHNGLVCNVPNQPVPLAAVGLSWSAQATLGEFGTVRRELSSVIYGTVDVCF
ncbi:MAG: hypothetical protein ABL998_06445 [Planctomycetota bacterium]